MQSLVVTAVLWSWQMSSPSSLRENPHPPEGKHCLPPWHPGVLHTGCWPPEHWGFNSLIKRPRSGEGDEGTKINLNSGKYKYSSRFYFPGGNCVSCLLSVLSLISRIRVQASGVQTGHKIYLLTCSSINWKQFEVGIVSDFCFHIANNPVNFQNECWKLGFLKMHKSLRESRWSAEPESPASMMTSTQDANFRWRVGSVSRTLHSHCRRPRFNPWSGN